MGDAARLKLMLTGDVMTGRGVDQVYNLPELDWPKLS